MHSPHNQLNWLGIWLPVTHPPRICVLLQDLQGGGGELVMLQLAAELASRSFDVELVLLRREGALLDLVPGNVRVHTLGTNRMLKSISALAGYLKLRTPAAVISAFPHINVGAIVAKMLVRSSTRVVVTEHNMISRNYSAVRMPTVRIAYNLVRLFYPRAAAVVAVSEGVAADLANFARIPRERISVIYNGIVTDRLRRLVEEPCDHPWFTGDGSPVILSVGRLAPVKDFETLIRAFSLIRSKRPARLVILGEGEERERLLTLASKLEIRDDVDLLGFTANPYPFMKRAAVFVQSSRWEGLPSVLIEALACGSRVVSTDCPGGTREILEGGRWGLLTPVGDPAKLADGILRTLDGASTDTSNELELRQRLDRFTTEQMVRSYLELVLGRPASFESSLKPE